MIEPLKLAIEFHGHQHDEYPNGFHRTKRQFIAAQKRDKIKADWLEENGYTLVVFYEREQVVEGGIRGLPLDLVRDRLTAAGIECLPLAA